jgi:SM-20-related protein
VQRAIIKKHMPLSPTIIDRAIDDIAQQGWSMLLDFMPQQAIEQLAGETLLLRQGGAMRQAGVGKGAERSINADTRGDFILWLEEPDLTAAQRGYLAQLEQFRLAANAQLQLGLFEFEGHLATYPSGSFYRKHIDRFRNDSLRKLTCILYLNHDWKDSDGGQLRLYLDGGAHIDILPQGGTLVTFLSDRFWHEVLPASRERMSITGWFKTRGEAPP